MGSLVNTINASEIFDEDEWIDFREDFQCLQNTNKKSVWLFEKSKSSQNIQKEPTLGATRIPRVNASTRQSIFERRASFLERFRAIACKSAYNLDGLEELKHHANDIIEQLCEFDMRMKNLKKIIFPEEETAT